MNHPDTRIPADANAPVETLYVGKWLSLRKRGRWEYAERNNPGGAVIILAVTPDDNVLFVEQYRVSILKHTIEMPAAWSATCTSMAMKTPCLPPAASWKKRPATAADGWSSCTKARRPRA